MGYERNGPQNYGRNYGRDYGRSRDERSFEGRYDRRPPRDYHEEDRGFLDRAGDEVRSWFGDDEAERRRRWDERVARREYEREHGPGSYDERYANYGVYAADPMFGSIYPGVDNGYGAGRGAGATSNWGLGSGPSHDGWGRDPNYNYWRRQQVEALDRDYDEYRRENQQRFESDFGSWRSTRDGQRRSLTQAQEHQEVIGSDGVHVGKVDHVRGDRIILAKNDKDSGGRHHSIPSSWIVSVDDKVTINRTASQAQSAWKDEEAANGPHNLNRAFSGTY